MKRRIVEYLNNTADKLQLAGASRRRYKSYREAAHFLKHIEDDIETLAIEGRLFLKLPVSKEVRRTIEDLLNGTIPIPSDGQYFEDDSLLSLRGVPVRYLEQVQRRLSIRARKDLDDAIHNGELDRLDWLPRTILDRMARALRPPERQARWTLGEILPLSGNIAGCLRGLAHPDNFSFTGKLRRGCEWIDGLFILAWTPAAGELHNSFSDIPGLVSPSSLTPSISRAVTVEGPPVELRTTDRASFGAMQIFHTGSPTHVKQLKKRARNLGMSLRDNRLSVQGKRLDCSSEAAVYERLELPFIPPELRRGRDEIERASQGALPSLLKSCHLAGDFHVHSNFSDGFSSIESLVESARKMKYSFLAVCDHSQSLKFARGLSPDRLRSKIKVIRRLSSSCGLKLLAGAEVDILSDGGLDYPGNLLDELDLVVGAVHLDLNDPPAKLTKRVINAVSSGRIDILAHPTCRILGSRSARRLDMEAVLTACKEHDVALEVNGHAHRMDPPVPFIEQALDMRIPLALASDAHHADQLWMMDLALLQARKAGAGPRSVLNTMSCDELSAFLSARRARRH